MRPSADQRPPCGLVPSALALSACPQRLPSALPRDEAGQQVVAVLRRPPAPGGVLGDVLLAPPALGLVAAAPTAVVTRLVLDRIEFEVGERPDPGQSGER